MPRHQTKPRKHILERSHLFTSVAKALSNGYSRTALERMRNKQRHLFAELLKLKGIKSCLEIGAGYSSSDFSDIESAFRKAGAEISLAAIDHGVKSGLEARGIKAIKWFVGKEKPPKGKKFDLIMAKDVFSLGGFVGVGPYRPANKLTRITKISLSVLELVGTLSNNENALVVLVSSPGMDPIAVDRRIIEQEAEIIEWTAFNERPQRKNFLRRLNEQERQIMENAPHILVLAKKKRKRN
jgi:hypothetical protein